MPLNTKENIDFLLDNFPGLIHDPGFKITSPIDKKYNCIAWAHNRDEVWMWPNDPQLDGTAWPLEDKSTHFSKLVEVFALKGFTICDGFELEAGYIKVALYVDEEDNFTHASRQHIDGIWKSKIGQAFDIYHANPHSIENEVYGKAKIFMSAKL